MPRHPFVLTQLAVAAALSVVAGQASATDLDLAGGKLSLNGSIHYGVVQRDGGRDPELLYPANAKLIGATGTAAGGKNQDDGNLNYGGGDNVSSAVKGLLQLGYTLGDFGFFAQGQAWHDYAQKANGVPFGNEPNGYVAGARLSDAGFPTRSRFAGAVLDELYVRGHHQFGEAALDWKAGNQRLDWGSRYTFSGGLGDLSPRDVPAARRAGALPEEGRIPVPAASLKLMVTPATTVEALVQTGFRPSALPGCGTFYSNQDFIVPGCNLGLLGAAADPATITAGADVKRTADVMPGNGGEGGLALRQKVDAIDAELGLTVVQFHSRTPYISAHKTQRSAGAPLLPKDPGGLNPTYFVTYPDNIQMLALSFEKRLQSATNLAGELSYRPNQPFQYNVVDMLNALASAAGPTPLRAAATATAAGGEFSGYERHKTVQLNLSAVQGLPAMMGAVGGSAALEFTYKNVPDLPNPSVMRFRRSDVYGQAPVGGAACPATSSAKTCSSDGYVSANAFAYRLRAGLRYTGVFDSVTVLPSITFGSDVSGWSEDGAINQGREFAIFSLKAEFGKSALAELAWQPMWGGAYNNLKDRSTIAVSAGYRF